MRDNRLNKYKGEWCHLCEALSSRAINDVSMDTKLSSLLMKSPCALRNTPLCTRWLFPHNKVKTIRDKSLSKNKSDGISSCIVYSTRLSITITDKSYFAASACIRDECCRLYHCGFVAADFAGSRNSRFIRDCFIIHGISRMIDQRCAGV